VHPGSSSLPLPLPLSLSLSRSPSPPPNAVARRIGRARPPSVTPLTAHHAIKSSITM
jgi:hypothetical protein